MNSVQLKRISELIIALILLFISYFVLKDASWVLGDDYQFITTTAIGRASHACYGGGRFWPLGLCDYNLLLLVPYGYMAAAHLIHNIIFMFVSIAVLFNLLNKISDDNYLVSTFFIIMMICSSSFVLIHISCIYAERMMLLMLSLFMLFYWKAVKYQSNKDYRLALFFMAYATYLKETVCGAVIVIALTNFMFLNLTKKDKHFNIALLVNVAIFLAIFTYRFLPLFKNGGAVYQQETLFHVFWLDVACNIFAGDPILIMIMIFATIRAYHVLLKKDRQHIFLDGLIFAAVSYICAYIIIGFSAPYYTFPAIVLALPSFVYWTSTFAKNRKNVFYASSTAFCLLVIPSIMKSAEEVRSNLYHRINDMNLVNWMMKEYHQGRDLVLYEENRGDIGYEERGAGYTQNWRLRVYNIFTNYTLGVSDKFASIFKKASALNDIPDDCIVLCAEDYESKFRNFILARGFKFIMRACDVDVYAKFPGESPTSEMYFSPKDSAN